MLNDIGMPLKLAGGEDSDLGFFSELGQFQAVYIYAIVELFKDRNCLTLLDEPDAFLHPEWQFEFLKQVIEITGHRVKNQPRLVEQSQCSNPLFLLRISHISFLKIRRFEPFPASSVQRRRSFSRTFRQFHPVFRGRKQAADRQRHPVLHSSDPVCRRAIGRKHSE